MKLDKGLAKGIAKISLIVLLLVVFGIFVLKVWPGLASGANIWTDKEDYNPGETVLISGSGFTPLSTVQINVTRPDGVVDVCPLDGRCGVLPITDNVGSFSNYAYVLNGIEGTYLVEASDGTNSANITFTDVTININTYKDSDYLIPEDSFTQGDTVYAKATGLNGSRYYKIEWFDPSGNSKKATVYGTGATSRNDSYTLSSDAAVGTWNVKVFEGNSENGPWGQAKATAPFCVWYPLAPTADSWVEQDHSNANHGSDNTLHVKWMESNKERITFLKFNLSSLPSGITINSAILHLYRSYDKGVPSAYKVSNDSWTETGITWSNKPTLGDKVTDGTGTALPVTQWITWNITSYAQAEYDRDKILSIALKFSTGPVNNASYHSDFTSREGTCNQTPWLEINYTSWQCQNDNDCNYLDRDYCDGILIKHVEGVCVDHQCVEGTPTIKESCDDQNECTSDACVDAVCQHTNLPAGTECGEARDCPENTCNGYFAVFYPPDGHDKCDGFGNCVVYSCNVLKTYCTDNDAYDGIDSLTCGAPCDQDSDCKPQLVGDYCKFNGKCNLGTDCSCSYQNEEYCPTPGYTNGTHCYWGTRSCTENGCGLTITEMDCKDYCNANLGPQDTIGPNVENIKMVPNPAGGSFCIPNITATAIENCTNISEVRYWFDTACAIGPGHPMQPSDGAFDEPVEDVEVINVPLLDENGYPLSDGGHNLYMRAKNSDGYWGPCVGVPVKIDRIEPETTNTKIENAHWIDTNGYYWICADDGNLTGKVCDFHNQSFICDAEFIVDKDTTYGNGYPMDPLDGTWGDSTCENVNGTIFNNQFSEGLHWAIVRGHDCACNWEKDSPKVWFVIDRSYPITTKTAGEPNVSCGDNCYFITKNTPITLTCSDPNNGNGYYSNDVTIHWRYQLNNNGTWFEFSHHGSQVTFTYPEDSNHTLEYWCSDACGNEEPHHFEIDIVDTLPPIIEKDFIGPTYYNETEGKRYIDGVTKIQITATDQQPHPVGGVTCDWDYEVLGGQKNGTGETGKVPPFNITLPEESTHNVSVVCRDALGNEGTLEFTVIVDKTPPETYKEYGEPYHFLCHEWKKEDHDGGWPIDVCVNYSEWVNSSTPITLTVEDTGVHQCGIKETKYRVTPVDKEYCFNPTPCQAATGSGDWQTYEQPFTISEESCHLIEYYSVDNVNKTEEVKKQCVFVDNTGPIVAKFIGEPKVNCSQGEGCNYYINQSTLITLQCIDQSPHPVGGDKIYYRYKVDSGDWTEWILYTGPFHFSEDSNHTLEYYCVDKLGNVGETRSEADKVDTVAPTTTKTYGIPRYPDDIYHAKWINSSTPITLTAQDGGAVCAVGLDKIYYRVTLVGDGNCSSQSACAQAEGSGDWLTYSNPFTISEDSCHLIEYFSVDKLGNVEIVKKQCVYVDNKSPISQKTVGEPKENVTGSEICSQEFTDGCYFINQNTQVNLTCSDQLPHPVDQVKIYYKIDWRNESSDQWQEGTDFVSFTYDNDSYHRLTWYCVDALGNKEQEHVELDIVDTQPPVTTKTVGDPKVSCGENCWYITSATNITLTCSDQEPHPVGEDKIYYRYYLDGQLKQDWTEYTVPFSLPEESNHTLEYYCVDKLGNEEPVKTEIDNVDNTPPEIIKAWVDDCSVHCDTPVKIFANVTDAKVGVKNVTAKIKMGYLITTITLTYNSTSGYYEGIWTPNCWLWEGTYYIDIKASDLLGNTATLNKATWTNVDNTKPSIYWVFSGKDWVGYGTTFYVAAEVTDNSLTSPYFKEICEPEITCVARMVDNTGKESVLDGSLTFNREIGKCTGFVTVNETFNESPANLYVDAWDNAGNYRDGVYRLIGIDNTPPVKVSFETNPEQGSTIKSGQRIWYNITFDQDMSGIKSPCYISINETRWDASPITGNECSGYYDVPSGLPDGEVKFMLKVEDVAGNWLEDSINFMLDNSPPVIELLQPDVNGTYDSLIPIEINITDEMSPIAAQTVQYRIFEPQAWYSGFLCLFGYCPYDSGWLTTTYNSTTGTYQDMFNATGLENGKTYFISIRGCDMLYDPVLFTTNNIDQYHCAMR